MMNMNIKKVAGDNADISLCMIVKDELQNLKNNLAPLIQKFPEVIVVDTGSIDGTREYLDDLPDHVRVLDFPWRDDFSAARNQYLKAATREWIYWMDADEYLKPSYLSILRSCTKKGADKAWAYRYQHGVTTFHIKLFPNLPGIQYIMRCHEQIYPSLVRAGVKELCFFPEPFKIVNPSYVEGPEQSVIRNIRLLKLDIHEKPEYLMSRVHLAYEYYSGGHYNKGIAVLDDLLSKKRRRVTRQDREAYRAAVVAKKMISLQKRLHKKVGEGKSLSTEEIKELIRLGGLR
jgi:glycosyltransferase involved in cell wall biosynthesis